MWVSEAKDKKTCTKINGKCNDVISADKISKMKSLASGLTVIGLARLSCNEIVVLQMVNV
jgi:hypothetical protein